MPSVYRLGCFVVFVYRARVWGILMEALNVLVTGVSGFVGAAVFKSLSENSNFNVTGVVRSSGADVVPTAEFRFVDDLGPFTDWSGLVGDVDVILHLAGKAHALNEGSMSYLPEYMRVNTEGTLNLARQAAAGGVRRFVFVSTVKVSGDMVNDNIAFAANTVTAPIGPYAISKNAAEVGLREIAVETGMQVTIIRPGMVYGPGVKGNLQKLMRFIDKGFPIPFGRVTSNRRSLIGIDNLVGLLILSLQHPAAANRTFLASDNRDISTYELAKLLRDISQSRSIIVPVPIVMLKLLGKVLRIEDSLNRLLGSLKMDVSETQSILQWSPSKSFEDGIREMVLYEQLKKTDL